MTLFKQILALVLLTAAISQAALADCQVTISQPEVNYGKIKRSDMTSTAQQWNALPERTVQLTVWCPQPQKMALFFEGNSGDKGAFVFGDQSAMMVVASQATLDGNAVSLNHTDSHGVFGINGETRDKQLVKAHQGLLPVRGDQVMSGQQFSMLLTLKPAMRKSELSVKDSHEMESNIQIQLETE